MSDKLKEILHENEECSFIAEDCIEPNINHNHKKLHLSYNPSI